MKIKVKKTFNGNLTIVHRVDISNIILPLLITIGNLLAYMYFDSVFYMFCSGLGLGFTIDNTLEAIKETMDVMVEMRDDIIKKLK